MTATTGGRVFHLLSGADRGAAEGAVERGAAIAGDQFERHGFVHCCFREQLGEIATWWFAEDDDLVALELDPTAFTSEMRLEPSPSRWYPHLYGPIDAAAVVAVHPLARASTGRVDLPPALAAPSPGFQVTGRLRNGGDERVVRWRAGALAGDAEWIRAAQAAIDDGQLVPLVGGISALPDLGRPYESFALLDLVAVEITRYDGDGFFEPEQ